MNRFIQYLAVVVLIFLAGCANIPGTSATPTMQVVPTNAVAATAPANRIPNLSGQWRIMLIQTGGIMGVSKSLEILGSGAVTATDMRSKKTSQTVLTTDRLGQLTDLVANSSYQPASMSSGCADCFIFNLEITSEGQKFQVEMNQIDIQKSGLQPLVDLLGDMMSSIQK